METCSKSNVKALSNAQIVMSAALFLIGLVDGLHIKFIYVSLAFLPCWIAALVFPVGVMGLALSSHQTLRTLQLLKNAIWSFCVVCIVCSALVLYIYTTRGLLYTELFAPVYVKSTGWLPRKDDGFLTEGDKVVYTEKEKNALAVFSFVIICSVIEIVLAAAMMKICETTTKTPQLSSSHGAYYQMGESQQSLQADPVGQQQVRVDVRDNQSSQYDGMNP